jgi:superfamily II DNA or RNA helicase
VTIVTRRPQLRDYQVSAIEAVEKAEGGAQHYCLVSLPTGTGKTLVFCELIRRRGGRALVIAHRDELLAQAQTKLVAAGIGAGTIGWVKAGRDEVSSPLVLASMQTLARRSRRERVIPVAICEYPGHFEKQALSGSLGEHQTPRTLLRHGIHPWHHRPGRLSNHWCGPLPGRAQL